MTPSYFRIKFFVCGSSYSLHHCDAKGLTQNANPIKLYHCYLSVTRVAKRKYSKNLYLDSHVIAHFIIRYEYAHAYKCTNGSKIPFTQRLQTLRKQFLEASDWCTAYNRDILLRHFSLRFPVGVGRIVAPLFQGGHMWHG